MNNRLLATLLFCFFAGSICWAEPVQLNKGDHICLVGNGQGEALQHLNYWETLLHTRFPEHELVVRNLCFPADEPYLRPRSANFGSPDDHLKHSQANVIFYFFGLNESFAGPFAVDKFKEDLTKLIVETKEKDYGKGKPKIVLISPMAHEDLHSPNLPDGSESNENLSLYTQAMIDVASTTGVAVADLFTPTKELFSGDDACTINGIHLSEAGAKKVAPVMDKALFGGGGAGTIDARLKAEVDEKNFQWWHRYRAVDGFYIYGGRSTLRFEPDKSISNADVMERERQILDAMVANRDQRIWQVAQGKSVPATIDDSNTPEFINVETNYHAGKQKGKQGSLEYIPVEQATKAFKMAEGYEINCFASEEDFPELANPVQFAFDGRGRLWVTTMPSYPQYQPKHELNDRVLILEDTDGDGKADKCTTFADKLHVPTGIELGDGGAYVAQQPDLMFLKDTDGDDVADVRVRVSRGYDSADSHHSLSAFTWGPGGGLYYQEGTFHHSQIETPYGATRLKDAGVFRYEPTTEKVEVFVSYGFANPWGHTFDRWGQSFVADASGGANYYGTAFSGHVDYPRKHAKMKQFINKRFRPTSGCEFVTSRHFPEEAQGRFLLNNCIGQQGVYQHVVADEGSGFAAKEIEPLLYTEDGNFRPVDLRFGPDGALYICDWQNALVGHMQHSIRDPHRDQTHGRIYRITHKGSPLLKPVNLEETSTQDLVALLEEYEDQTRYRVRRELRSRDPQEVVAALKTWIDNMDQASENYEHNLLEALWVHQHLNIVNQDLLARVHGSEDYRSRAAATRVVGYWRDRVNAKSFLAKSAIDDHPRVRLEAIRVCSFMTGDMATTAAEIALMSLEKPDDDYLKYVLQETMETLNPYLQQ